MNDFPKLPDGYTWKVRYSHCIFQTVKVRVYRWGWWRVDDESVIVEEDDVDAAARYGALLIWRRLERKIEDVETKHYMRALDIEAMLNNGVDPLKRRPQ